MDRNETPSGETTPDTSPRTHTARDPQEDRRSLSTRVVESVADATGTDPERMRPLNDVVDPDALDRLFAPRADDSRRPQSGWFSFQFEGCDVTVHANGRTVVTPPDDRP